VGVTFVVIPEALSNACHPERSEGSAVRRHCETLGRISLVVPNGAEGDLVGFPESKSDFEKRLEEYQPALKNKSQRTNCK
jgi:hypothetical protein